MGGALCPFCAEVGPRMAWADVYFRTKWRLHPSSRLATINMGQKLGGGGCALCSWVPSSTVWLGPRPHLHAKCHLDSSSRLATINTGQKLGGDGCALCSAGSCVPIKHKVAWAEAYLHTKWHHSPSSHLATTDTGRKFGGRLCPFTGGGAGSPSNTMLCRLRPTSIPSGILIHAAVWPQQMWAEN